MYVKHLYIFILYQSLFTLAGSKQLIINYNSIYYKWHMSIKTENNIIITNID